MNRTLLKHVTGNLYSDSQKLWLRLDNQMIGVILSSVVRPVDEFSMALPSDKPLKPREDKIEGPIQDKDGFVRVLSEDQIGKPVAIVDDKNLALNALSSGS